MGKLLEVKNLNVQFRTQNGLVKAIRNVSFDLSEGETLCLVGESGSGKSVTSKAIMGLLAKNGFVANGSIMYNKKDITKMSKEEIHEVRGDEIAMIFQDPMTSLNPTMKIGKQIAEAYRIHKPNSTKEQAKRRAIELIKEVGITRAEQRYNAYPHQFSGGMRQRIVIAIALACEPKVLICDEPTTALDVTIQAQILDLLNELKKKHNTSLIFITHDLGVVANMADRVAVMYAGQVVEVGTVDEIFYKPEHPYTWGLLASMPDLDSDQAQDLVAIPGTPPNLLKPPKGDAFSLRSEYAMEVDKEHEPPMFKISDTHYAKTWLLHEHAPKVERPAIIKERQKRYKG